MIPCVNITHHDFLVCEKFNAAISYLLTLEEEKYNYTGGARRLTMGCKWSIDMLSWEHKMQALWMPKRKYPNDKEKIVDIDIKDNINIFIDKG